MLASGIFRPNAGKSWNSNNIPGLLTAIEIKYFQLGQLSLGA
jgi:hypothetical protein